MKSRPVYTIIVGNVGSVLTTTSKQEAERTFREYQKQSKTEYGRASGESVYWLQDGDIYLEHEGHLRERDAEDYKE